MTITSMASDGKFAYTLNDGVIARRKLDIEGNVDTIAGPGGTIVQLSASNGFLFALQDDGDVYRRYSDRGAWTELTALPSDVSVISAGEKELYIAYSAGATVASLKMPGDGGYIDMAARS